MSDVTSMAPANPAVEILGLSKKFGDMTAVDNLSMRIQQGEIYGFLGRNGAGKTTTIRVLLGLAAPTSGDAKIFGTSVVSNRLEALAGVGSLVETATAYPNLTVLENLRVHCRLLGCTQSSVDSVVGRLALEPYAKRLFGKLSLGNKQRVALARAMLGNPRLLVLDEPANGLDPAGIAELRQLLRGFAENDAVTVLVSSHLLGEVSLLVDRIGIIHRGHLVRELEAGQLSTPKTGRLRVDTSRPAEALKLVGAAFEGVSGEVAAGQESLVLTGKDLDVAEIARLLVVSGFPMLALVPLDDDLESLFLGLTGGGQ